MKPIAAVMLNGMPRSVSANTPPVIASGMPEKTIAAWRRLPSAKLISTKITTSVAGTTIASRACAVSRLRNWPPNLTE